MKNNVLNKINYIRDKVDKSDKVTFIELVTILGSIKVRVLWGIATGIISYSSIIYFMATKFQIEKTAIALGKSFDISINKNELQTCTESTNQKGIICKEVYVLENVGLPGTGNLQFEIRKIDNGNPQDISTIGMIQTKEIKQKNFLSFPKYFNINQLEQPALAQDNDYSFNWYKHENNTNFHETYVDHHTIRRYYKDGWILEYKIDQNKHSIPSTFKWIRKGRCLFGICL